MANLISFATLIDNIKSPEELFGKLNGSPQNQLSELQKGYRQFVKIVYIDHQKPEDVSTAEKAFKKLSSLKDEAEKRIVAGVYGDVKKNVPAKHIQSKHLYIDVSKLSTNGVVSSYKANCKGNISEFPVLIRMAKNPTNNSLVLNEIKILKKLRSDGKNEGMCRYCVPILESFASKEDGKKRQCLVTPYNHTCFFAKAVKDSWPHGIELKQSAWMINRLFEGLWYTHELNISHGCITPSNLVYNVKTHQISLYNWFFSGEIGSKITAILPQYRDWYPPEVFTEKMLTKKIDIYMAAYMVNYFLSGKGRNVSTMLPKPMQFLMRACLSESPSMRPHDAGQVREDFGKIFKDLFGPNKFVPFTPELQNG